MKSSSTPAAIRNAGEPGVGHIGSQNRKGDCRGQHAQNAGEQVFRIGHFHSAEVHADQIAGKQRGKTDEQHQEKSFFF